MLETIGAWLQSAYALSVLPLGLAWALTPALARRSAALRHHVWVVALAIAVVAPVARSAVPRLNVPLLPASDIVSPLQPTRVIITDAPQSATTREAHTPSAAAWPATAIAALVWMLGAVPLLCLRALRRTRLRRLVAEAIAVDAHTNVRSHARVGVPMLAGLRRPTILLPLSAAQWPLDTREAVLAHECAHVQRYDHVIAFISDVATTVYWLNPLVWLAAAALDREREAACDEEVLRAGMKPSVYAAVLLTVADMLPARRAATVPSIAGGRLDARIRAVLHRTPHSGRVPLSWPATMALIGVCAALVASVRIVARTPAQTMSAGPTPAPTVALLAPSLVTDASPAVEAQIASGAPAAQAPSQPAPAAPTPATPTSQTGPDSAKQDEPSPRPLTLPESQPRLFQASDQVRNPPGARLFGAFQFDTKGVDFSLWMKRFIQQVYANWIAPPEAATLAGHVVITFQVHKSGAITDITVTAPCPIDGFNTAAFGSLVAANPTPPLPPEYPDEKAFFTVTFSYNEPTAGAAPAQAMVGVDVYQPGNGVTTPTPTTPLPKPAYTPAAMRAQIQGVVRVTCVVQPTGVCTDIAIARSLDPTFGLDEEAVSSVRRWRFTPGQRSGEPVAVRVTIDVEFRLPREAMAGAAPAQAQGRIAGTAKDADSGAPLKGVTVTVASDALPEGSRTATTDGDGAYTIANLPPGTYTVDFTLMEHTTVRREQLQLLTNGAATTLNVLMKEARTY